MVYGQEKFIIVRQADDNAVMYPLSRFKYYVCGDNSLSMVFDSGNTDVDAILVIALDADTGNDELSVAKTINRTINGSKSNYVVIGDGVTGEFLEGMTGIAIT